MAVMKTKNYEMFKFRSDNRAVISEAHVNKIAESIRERNLLEFRPICVNGDMEIIDGQNRLLAAKKLGVEIYYEVVKSLTGADMLHLNINKQWGTLDFLNYYVKNGYEHYQKFDKFMRDNNLNMKVAITIQCGKSHDALHKFKIGKFEFVDDGASTEILDNCWQTTGYIKKVHGSSAYLLSAKFWTALISVMKHPDFNMRKWMDNLERFSMKIAPKTTLKNYIDMILDVYNWRNTTRIRLGEVKVDEE